MIENINQINSILDLVIKVSIITGILSLVYFFIKLKFLESKIESKYNKFEKDKDNALERAREGGVVEAVYNGQVEKLQKDKDESIAPLEREKQRIISKIPFMK